MHDQADEGGFSLIEVLLAVVILGLAVVGLVGSLGTGLIASRTHRHQADANTVLLRAMETIKTPSVAYNTTCDATATKSAYAAAAQAAITTLPVTWTSSNISVSDIKYWNGASAGYTATCMDNLMSGTTPVTTFRQQLVTVLVTSPGGAATESLSFVKRG